MDLIYINTLIEILRIEAERIQKKLIDADERYARNYNLNEEALQQKLNWVKKQRCYVIMKDTGNELTDSEIMAILLYCDLDFFCYELRKSHRERRWSCEWKTLFANLCSAVNKLHKVFHFQNKSFKRHRKGMCLLHGNKIPYLTDKQKSKLTLNTITSFTTCWSVAQTFADRFKQDRLDEPDGMILVIKDANELLYDGTLKGADVSWLSAYKGEAEFIILPTEFYDFESVDVEDRVKRGWCIPSQYHMYITSKCVSKCMDGPSYSQRHVMKWVMGYRNGNKCSLKSAFKAQQQSQRGLTTRQRESKRSTDIREEIRRHNRKNKIDRELKEFRNRHLYDISMWQYTMGIIEKYHNLWDSLLNIWICGYLLLIVLTNIIENYRS